MAQIPKGRLVRGHGKSIHGSGVPSTVLSRWYILPETNVAPENGWLEDEIAYWEGLFSRDMLVSQRVVDLTLQLTPMGGSQPPLSAPMM